MRVNNSQQLMETVAQLTGIPIQEPPKNITGKKVRNSVWESEDMDARMKQFCSSVFIGKTVGYIACDKASDTWESLSEEERLKTPTKIYYPKIYTIENIGKDDSLNNGGGLPVLILTLKDSKGGTKAEPFSVRDIMDMHEGMSDDEVMTSLQPLLSSQRGLYTKLHCSVESLKNTIRVLNDQQKAKLEAAMVNILKEWTMLSNADNAVLDGFESE